MLQYQLSLKIENDASDLYHSGITIVIFSRTIKLVKLLSLNNKYKNLPIPVSHPTEASHQFFMIILKFKVLKTIFFSNLLPIADDW